MARKSRQAVARECLKEPATRAYVVKQIGIVVRNELKAMCSDCTSSLLRSQNLTDLHGFSWDKLIAELSAKAPVFLDILRAATFTRRPRKNQNSIIGLCAAVLLKHRFAKMSLVQKLISLILYAGHSGKKVCLLNKCINSNMTFLIRCLCDCKRSIWQCHTMSLLIY